MSLNTETLASTPRLIEIAPMQAGLQAPEDRLAAAGICSATSAATTDNECASPTGGCEYISECVDLKGCVHKKKR